MIMEIGGLNTFSLSDFPGKVAAVVFTQGCNFRCPYCHNGSLNPQHAPSELLIPQEHFFEFLEYRSNRLDAVVVSGGEPTIHRDLPAFMRRIKDMGFAVKLDTNGSKPEILKEILENNLVDYIAMDIKAPLDKYKKLIGTRLSPMDKDKIKESIELISESGVDHEFRTTVVEALLTPEDMQVIRKLIPSGSTYRLQKFCPEHAFDPALRTKTNMYLGDPLL
jgi:pyruvate formate lyase activating enzyme